MKTCLLALCMSSLLPWTCLANEPTLSKRKVARLADAAIKQGGLDPSHYRFEGAAFNFDGYGPHEWLVNYSRKASKQQSSTKEAEEVYVQVDDRTGQAVIGDGGTGKPLLSKQEVVRLADAAAKQRGVDLRRYSRSTPDLGKGFTRYQWLVFYEGKPNARGIVVTDNRFGVYVHDRSKKTEFLPGP